MNTVSRFILIFLLPPVVAACAAAPRQYTDPRPLPSAAHRADFGVIGIAVGISSDAVTPPAPKSMSDSEKMAMTLGGGAIGAGTGAIVGLGCGPVAGACVPILAAATGAAGLLVGAATSIFIPSPEKVNSADITLRNTLLSADADGRLVRFVTAQAARTTDWNLWSVDPVSGAVSWQSRDGGEVDTLLVLDAPAVSLVRLNTLQQRNPDVRLEMVVEGRILRKGSEFPIFERRWRHDSEVHDYFDWAEDQGALILTELDKAISTAGAQIVADLLGRRTKEASGGSPVTPRETGPPADESGEEKNAIADFFTRVGDFLGGLFGNGSGE